MTARVATHTPNDVVNLCSDAPTVRGLSNRRYERLDGICQLGFRLRRSGINLSFEVKLVKDLIGSRAIQTTQPLSFDLPRFESRSYQSYRAIDFQVGLVRSAHPSCGVTFPVRQLGGTIII